MSFQKMSSMLLYIALCVLALSACQKENGQGTAQIEITDAPIDNANVTGAFVTIADIKIDGKSVKGFNKTTVDLMAYQNGTTKVLGNFDLDAKTYSSITLVLDHETDASGATPGCYVLANGTKHTLATAATEIKVDKAYEIPSEGTSNLVIDFDLRKSITATGSGGDNYSFVTAAELNAALRLVAKSKAGKINGNCSDSFSNSDKIVVYAYKQGSYTRSTETQAQGSSNLEFKNAVTSSAVDANGNYTLSFLEEGTYELHYASYTENSSTGKLELQGTLNVNALTSINLGGISLDASATITANVLVTGLLPL